MLANNKPQIAEDLARINVFSNMLRLVLNINISSDFLEGFKIN